MPSLPVPAAGTGLPSSTRRQFLRLMLGATRRRPSAFLGYATDLFDHIFVFQLERACAGVLHGSTRGWPRLRPHLNSCDAGGVWASQFQHPVQDVDGDANLGAPPPILARAQPFADHLLVTPDGSLNSAALVVA